MFFLPHGNPLESAMDAGIRYNQGMESRACRVWGARVLIGMVTAWNLLAAFQFLIAPDQYVAGFELSGTVGEAMVRAMGLLFLMWNVPYLFALIAPVRNHTSLLEAFLMQIIAVTGESLLLVFLQGDHITLRQSVMRFIYFDATGVLLLAVSLAITYRKKPVPQAG